MHAGKLQYERISWRKQRYHSKGPGMMYMIICELLPLNTYWSKFEVAWIMMCLSFTWQVASESRITVAESSGPAYINVTSTVPLHLFCEQSHRDNIELCNAHVSIELVRGFIYFLHFLSFFWCSQIFFQRLHTLNYFINNSNLRLQSVRVDR